MVTGLAEYAPKQDGLVYYQHAVDRIVYARDEKVTPSMALKCIGLYTVICRLAVDDEELTQTKLAESIGTTFPGLSRPLQYLRELKLVRSVPCKSSVRPNLVNHLHVDRPVVDMIKRDLKKAAAVNDEADFKVNGLPVPEAWYDNILRVISLRFEGHTAGKALKALGILPFMARLAADGLPVTRPVLARRIGLCENTLTPLINFLEEAGLVEIERRRIPGHIGTEYATHIPEVVVDRVRRALRKMEREAQTFDWPDSEMYRDLDRKIQDELAQTYGWRGQIEAAANG